MAQCPNTPCNLVEQGVTYSLIPTFLISRSPSDCPYCDNTQALSHQTQMGEGG